MMEIVHDLAPSAHLIFATAFTSEESFADNIRALRAAGADIIVDDVVYFAESPFQDGRSGAGRHRRHQRRRALLQLRRQRAATSTTAPPGNWEGDFDASGQTIGKFAGEAHDFDPGAARPGARPGLRRLRRRADDPAVERPARVTPATTTTCTRSIRTASVLAFSNDVQDGNDDPFEGFNLPFGTGRRWPW